LRGFAYCLRALAPPDFPYCLGELAGSMPTRLIPRSFKLVRSNRTGGCDVTRWSGVDTTPIGFPTARIIFHSRLGRLSVVESGDQRVKNTTGERHQAMREKVMRNCSKIEEMATSRCEWFPSRVRRALPWGRKLSENAQTAHCPNVFSPE